MGLGLKLRRRLGGGLLLLGLGLISKLGCPLSVSHLGGVKRLLLLDGLLILTIIP